MKEALESLKALQKEDGIDIDFSLVDNSITTPIKANENDPQNQQDLSDKPTA